jgi:predicted trehalose synthase
MIVERTSNEILLKISPNVDKFGMERVLEYIEYLELTSNQKTRQSDADRLADELNENWWKQNKNRFLK